jgi:hypothetical protein
MIECMGTVTYVVTLKCVPNVDIVGDCSLPWWESFEVEYMRNCRVNVLYVQDGQLHGLAVLIDVQSRVVCGA